jgi:ABC-type multidrug transport system fused ATPase/permease subunit
MAWVQGLEAGLMAFLAHFGMWAVLTLTVGAVASGGIDGVYLAPLSLGVLAAFEAAQPLPTAARHLVSSLTAAGRLFELIDTRPAVTEIPAPVPGPEAFDLQVSELSFRYREDEPLALHKVSFDLPQGGRLAVVGPSGAGKTTLVNLLLRFWEYRPQGHDQTGGGGRAFEAFEPGEVRLGGVDLWRYRQEDIQRSIGVVSQDTYLFNATVRENLLIARPAAGQTEVRRAAEAARIHDFIQTLPDGYETRVGEQGVRLSGGERQRLALARVLLADTPMMLLDEPTVNLDALTEREIMGEILDAMVDRTSILVTHRLTGLEAMDQILVLVEGRVVARGRHRDLLARPGWYRRMWELQGQILPY